MAKRCHGKSIEADYRICFGAPRLVRHRLKVETVVERLFAGCRDELGPDFGLTEREIRAVEDYVFKLIARDGEVELSDAYWEGKGTITTGGEQ